MNVSAANNHVYLDFAPNTIFPKKLTYLTGTYGYINGNTFQYVGPWIMNRLNTVGALSFHNVEVSSIDTTIHVFPNPAKEKITIYFDETILNNRVSVFDAQGKIITQQTFINETEATLNTETLLPGIYFVQIQNETTSVVKKLVIE